MRKHQSLDQIFSFAKPRTLQKEKNTGCNVLRFKFKVVCQSEEKSIVACTFFLGIFAVANSLFNSQSCTKLPFKCDFKLLFRTLLPALLTALKIKIHLYVP